MKVLMQISRDGDFINIFSDQSRESLVVPLEECLSASEILKWQMKLMGMPWYQEEQMGEFVALLNGLCWLKFEGPLDRVFGNGKKAIWKTGELL